MSALLRVILLCFLLGACGAFSLIAPPSPSTSPRFLSRRHPQASCRISSSSTRISMAIVGIRRYSTEDWLYCLRTLPSSRILKRTKNHIGFVSLWSALVTSCLKWQKSSFWLPHFFHAVLGSALGLLLVFRTNTSYDRFWEGRKSQSLIILACRNIASHAYVHIPQQHHASIAALLTAFALLQKQHLQGVINHDELKPLSPFLQSESSREVRELLVDIKSKRNRPLYLIRVLEKLLHDSLMNKYAQAALASAQPRSSSSSSISNSNSSSSSLADTSSLATYASTSPKYIEKHFVEALQSLGSQLATCERILKQPVPLSYSRHTSRFLTFYLLTLPFALVNSLGWLTVPLVTSICWSFVSIQEIGHFIEEPFDKKTQVIPLNQIASVIRADVSELLDDVIASSEIDEVEAVLVREMVDNSRNETEDFFKYYMQPDDGSGSDSSSSG